VRDVRLMRDRAGQTRGVGFVTFYSVDAAAHALEAIRSAGGEVTIDGARCGAAFSRGAADATGVGVRRARREEGEERLSVHQGWPTPFAADAAAYTFDAASGYFFEPISGFYFDPKQKIYYAAHRHEYFYYVMDCARGMLRFFTA